MAAVTPETAPEKTRVCLGLGRGAPVAPPPIPHAGGSGRRGSVLDARADPPQERRGPEHNFGRRWVARARVDAAQPADNRVKASLSGGEGGGKCTATSVRRFLSR